MCLSFQIRQSLFLLPFFLNLFATFSQTNLATANKLKMGHTAKSTSLALLGKIILVPIILKRPLFYEDTKKLKNSGEQVFQKYIFFNAIDPKTSIQLQKPYFDLICIRPSIQS